jgi:hypothetical protein
MLKRFFAVITFPELDDPDGDIQDTTDAAMWLSGALKTDKADVMVYRDIESMRADDIESQGPFSIEANLLKE